MTRTRKLLLVVPVGATVLSAFVAHASSQSTGSRRLAANAATVTRCDTDGVSVVQNLSGANVISVTVGSIAAACGNGTLALALNNGTTSSSGSASVPDAGGSLTVTLAAAVAAKDADQVDISISGP